MIKIQTDYFNIILKLILFTFSLPLLVFPDLLTTKISDGREVILYPDGHWKFTSNDSNLTSETILSYSKDSADLAIPFKKNYLHPPFSSDPFSYYYFESTYDKFGNVTKNKISLKIPYERYNNPREPYNSTRDLYLTAYYFYEGTTPTIVNHIMLGFTSISSDWEYLNCSSLKMLIDGNRKNFNEMEHRGTVGEGYVIEGMYQSIPISDFLEITNAKSVEIQLFTTEFKLSNPQLEALQDFISRGLDI